MSFSKILLKDFNNIFDKLSSNVLPSFSIRTETSTRPCSNIAFCNTLKALLHLHDMKHERKHRYIVMPIIVFTEVRTDRVHYTIL